MATNLIGKAVAENYDKIIEGAKLGANNSRLECIHLYPSEYNDEWTYNAELLFNIGGTTYGKKLSISNKAQSEAELSLDANRIGKLNNLLLKAFEVENPNFIAILQASPVEKAKTVQKYGKDVVVDEYRPQQLLNKDIVVVMKKNNSGYFDIDWIFNPNDKDGIKEAEERAKEVATVTTPAKPTKLGGANRPSIGGANRPTIKAG